MQDYDAEDAAFEEQTKHVYPFTDGYCDGFAGNPPKAEFDLADYELQDLESIKQDYDLGYTHGVCCLESTDFRQAYEDALENKAFEQRLAAEQNAKK